MVFIRNRLKYALNKSEVVGILKQRLVQVSFCPARQPLPRRPQAQGATQACRMPRRATAILRGRKRGYSRAARGLRHLTVATGCAL